MALALPLFSEWSIYLPRVVSTEADHNAAYVKGRGVSNPHFFEQIREELTNVLKDIQMLHATGGILGTAEINIPEAFSTILHAQRTAKGFLSNTQYHKALAVGELCVEIIDALAESQQNPEGFLFWRVLCRANLGETYSRFKKRDEARSVLLEGIQLVEATSQALAATSAVGPSERVLMACCCAHLARLELELKGGSAEEAQKFADQEIEVFEKSIWDLSDLKEDKENISTAMATAYARRGTCDLRLKQFEGALKWFGKAQECAERHVDLGSDGTVISIRLKDQMEDTRREWRALSIAN